MFASKTPRDIIRTPEGDALIASGDYREEEVYGIIPDRFHNEPSWLLTAFRDEPREPGETDAERIAWWKGFGADHRSTATDEEREHFRRVLTRLARFTEQETPA